VDIKNLHQAIKELRAELDRVNLAIESIERIAEVVGSTQQTAKASSEPKRRPAEPSGNGE
jgi:hypothetical protein